MSPSTMVRRRSGLYVPISDAYDALVLSFSPLRYYKFNETSGNLLDHGSNGQDGTLINAPTQNGANGYTFNGTNQSVQLPTTGLPTGNPLYSMELVFKPSVVSGQKDVMTWGGSATGQAASSGMNGTNFWHYFNSFNVTTSGVTATTTSWWHYLFTFDLSTASIYINGTLRGSAARTGHSITSGGAWIARSLANSAFYAGNVRRAAIHNSSLTPTNAANLAAAAPLT